MKSRILTFVAVVLFAAVATPAGRAQGKAQFHHYALIDMGTLGGPQSSIEYFVNLNNSGTVSGSADTSEINPYYGADNPTFYQDPYIQHAFGWKNGVLSDLGSLPGGGVSQPNCINQSGSVAGNASNSSIDPIGGWPESRAVVYQNGQVLNLGTLDGGYESAATCISDAGVVVGFAGDSTLDPYSLGWLTQTHGFRWTKSTGMQDLGSLGGPDLLPMNVNDFGQISGFAFINSTPNSTTGLPTLDPFLWDKGKLSDLGGLGGTASDLLFGEGPFMNSSGQVAGNSDLAGDVYFHPFLWTKPGPMQDLGTLGGHFGAADRIDDTGEVVGWATTDASDQFYQAFLWKNQKMTNLGTVDGDSCSIAWFARNGQVVGASNDCVNDVLHAFLWENGSIVDLNSLVPSGSGVELVNANYINASGEIVAHGVLSNGDSHASLLIPCDANHPNIKGCNYSTVEAEKPSRPTTETRSRITGISPTSAQVGAVVEIHGHDLEHTKAVTFSNGVNASFTVDSRAKVTTTVPAGAVSGVIAITTPHTVIESQDSFVVEPVGGRCIASGECLPHIPCCPGLVCAPASDRAFCVRP